MDIREWDAAATMLGAIIGAGVLGLPYVVAKAGILPGLVMIIALGGIMTLVNLMMGEICLRTKGDHQVIGLAQRYLGTKGKNLMLASIVIGIVGALAAYTIGLGVSLAAILGGNPVFWQWVSFGLLALFLMAKLKSIETSERYISSAKVLLIAGIIVFAFIYGDFSTANFTPASSWTLPFGVILFAFLGTAVIPEAKEEMKGHLKGLKRAILAASIIPIVLYVGFAIAVIGILGASTSELVTVGLGEALGPWAAVGLNLFAVLALASAFLALGEAMKKSFEEDYGWTPARSWMLSVAMPMGVLLVGAGSFIGLLGKAGAIAGGIDGVLIAMMFVHAKKTGDRKPEYNIKTHPVILIVISTIFVLGMVWAFTQL